jgi:AhpD family alkylhydroperoxidase
MPRIPALPGRAVGFLTRVLFWYSRRRFGAVPEPFAVLAHHPRLLWALAMFEAQLVRSARRLPASLRDLAVYRVATQVGCSWCVDFGTMLARLQGLDLDRLTEIDSYATSPRFTELERAVLAFADAMTAQPPRVDDGMVAHLDRELGHDGLVELTFMIAVENMRARCFHALGITDQGFSSGDVCAVPPSRRTVKRVS